MAAAKDLLSASVLFDGEPRSFSDVPLAAVPHLLHGAGLFSTMRLRDGAPLFLDRHLARLWASLAAVPAVPPPAPELLDASRLVPALAELVARGEAPADGVARLTVASGHVLVTFRAPPNDEGASVIERIDASSYRSGDLWPTHKTTSYLRSFASLGEPVIFANERGELCETPAANVFVVHGATMWTPPTSAPCLPGVARAVLLERGAELGLDVREEPVPADHLQTADACLLTNGVRLATAVASAFGRALPMSAALAEKARELLLRVAHEERGP